MTDSNINARFEIAYMVEVMQAFVDGENIEQRKCSKDSWRIVGSPSWDWSNKEYRIAPKLYRAEGQLEETRKHIDVLMAFDRGEQIQSDYVRDWTDVKNPTWNFNNVRYRVKPKYTTCEPYSEKYRELAIQEAESFCPDISPCKKCGGPVIQGYCCNHCGDPEPYKE